MLTKLKQCLVPNRGQNLKVDMEDHSHNLVLVLGAAICHGQLHQHHLAAFLLDQLCNQMQDSPTDPHLQIHMLEVSVLVLNPPHLRSVALIRAITATTRPTMLPGRSLQLHSVTKKGRTAVT